MKDYKSVKPIVPIPKQLVKEIPVKEEIVVVEKKENKFTFDDIYLHSTSLAYGTSIISDDINTNLNNKLTNDSSGYNLRFNLKHKKTSNKILILELEYLNNEYKKKEHYSVGLGHDFMIKQFLFSIDATIGISKLTWTKNPISDATATDNDSLSSLFKLNFKNKYNINKNYNFNINISQSIYSHSTELQKGLQVDTIKDTGSTNLNFEIEYKF